MTDRSELTESDIKKIKNLIEIEDIKKMRLHYSYFMDIRDLDKLMKVFFIFIKVLLLLSELKMFL